MRLIQQILISLNLCFIEIWSNKLRTLITSFGIFLGVVSYLVNVAFIRGIDIDITKNMEQIGGLNIITIKKKTSTTEEEKIEFNNSSGMKLDEIQEIVSSLPYIKSTLPKEELEWEMIKSNGKNTYTKPIAVSQAYLQAYNYEVDLGRGFTEADYTDRLNVCMIGSRIKEALFGENEEIIGKTVTIFNQTFTIKGIIKTEDSYSWKSVQFLFPYSLYSYKFGKKDDQLDEMSIELLSSKYAEKAVIDITRLLKQKHRGIEDFEIESNQEKLEELRAASKGIRVLLSTISIITLCIGGISIMNIMFAALGDRIREIGIRKALGARRVDLFMQFIIEAVTVSFAGGIPGIIIGSSIIFFPKGFFPYVPTLSTNDFVSAILFTMLCGIIAGFTPALRAAFMKPIDALRY